MDRNGAFLSYLGTLDDDYYFLIATTVLGKVPSPFHKPVLSNRILNFLLNKENRNGILSSITKDEAAYISMIWIMGAVDILGMRRLFPQDSAPVIVTRLQNLKDRLILIQTGNTFKLNPVLEKDLECTVLDFDLLFGPAVTNDMGFPLVDRNILFAILNLTANGSIPARKANEHHFIKSNKLETIFPSFCKEKMVTVYELIRTLAEDLGGITLRGNRYHLQMENLHGLLNMDSPSLCINAIAHSRSDNKGYRTITNALSRLVEILRAHCIPKQVLLGMLSHMLENIETKEAAILQDMESLGMVIEQEGCIVMNSRLLEEPLKRSELHVDTDLMVSYYGIPEPDDILYRIADIQVCDTVISYRVTKDSFTRALSSGISSDTIKNYLKADAFMQTQFDQWEQAFSRVHLYDGIVLQCDSMTSQLVKAHPQLQQHLLKELSEGLFLMKRSTYNEWQAILAHAMDMKALPDPEGENPPSDHEDNLLERIELGPEINLVHDRTELLETEELKKILLADASKKGCLNENVKDMIESGLIVSKDQLDKGFKYSSMPCVSGFDYNAKLTAIKGAIKAGTLLKLELTDETIVVHPVSLTKVDARNNMLKAIVIPDGTERTIAVSSMFMITVMRRTLGL